jgi:hypothetical protein
MSDPSLNSLHLQHCVPRWQAGDRAAAGETTTAAALTRRARSRDE